MTEAQWLVSEEPRDLLTALRGRASGRKLALYDCALRRFCSRLRVSESPLEAIGVAEEFADRDHAWARTGGAEARYYEESSEYLLSRTVDYAARLAQFVVEYTERRPCPPLIDLPHGSRAIERHVTAACTSFLRDLFGNPFRPITFPPRNGARLPPLRSRSRCTSRARSARCRFWATRSRTRAATTPTC